MSMSDLWQRSVLRRAAQRYTNHGWSVMPGAYLAGDRYQCGALCPTVACHPAVDRWETSASCEAADVELWWARAPFSVLLPTGRAFDVIEVPARLGLPAARSAMLGPVVVAPTGRWMFLVQPGEALRPELTALLDVVLHGRGSWVPAPPTRTPEGRIRWEVPPAATRWQLPDPYVVQQLLARYVRPMPTFASSSPALRRVA
jgi:hypothetical protein